MKKPNSFSFKNYPCAFIVRCRCCPAGRRSWGPGDRGTIFVKTVVSLLCPIGVAGFVKTTTCHLGIVAYLGLLQGTLLQDLLDHVLVDRSAKLVLQGSLGSTVICTLRALPVIGDMMLAKCFSFLMSLARLPCLGKRFIVPVGGRGGRVCA